MEQVAATYTASQFGEGEADEDGAGPLGVPIRGSGSDKSQAEALGRDNIGEANRIGQEDGKEASQQEHLDETMGGETTTVTRSSSKARVPRASSSGGDDRVRGRISMNGAEAAAVAVASAMQAVSEEELGGGGVPEQGAKVEEEVQGAGAPPAGEDVTGKAKARAAEALATALELCACAGKGLRVGDVRPGMLAGELLWLAERWQEVRVATHVDFLGAERD